MVKKCFFCGSSDVVRNGLRGHKQLYKCKSCGRQFVGGYRRDKSQVITDYVEGKQTDISDGQSLDDFLLREERTGLLRRAIAALPQQCRTVLQLVLLEELDCEEVAALLHITNSSVRAHLTRAKQKLINYVKDERR